MTTYHFEEKADDKTNGSNTDLYSKQEENYDKVDTITIRKYNEH